MNRQHQAVPTLAPEVSQGTCAHILQADVAVRAAPALRGRQLGQEARQFVVFLCHTGNRLACEQEVVDRLHMPLHQRSSGSCVYVYQIPHRPVGISRRPAVSWQIARWHAFDMQPDCNGMIVMSMSTASNRELTQG